MFNSKYKEDALKWRKHQEGERKKIEDEEYKLTIVVGLMDGEQVVLKNTFNGSARCYYDCWYIDTAKQRADRFYNDLKHDAFVTGVTIDSVTYMPHTIATITRQDD